MADPYRIDPELTALTTLDGEDVFGAPHWTPTVGVEIKKTRPVAIISSDEVEILPLKVIVSIAEVLEIFEIPSP